MLTEHGGWGQRGGIEAQREEVERGVSSRSLWQSCDQTQSDCVCVCVVTMRALVFLAHTTFHHFFYNLCSFY